MFYLGTHQEGWLARPECADVPLFVSRRRLVRRRRAPRAVGRWALDSGGFTELNMNGRWLVSPDQYADEVRRWSAEIGNMDWAAVQDWMCEPIVREKTGLSVEQHQQLTIESYLTLRSLAPEMPWVPVLQGWQFADYLTHVEMYASSGVNLCNLDTVGLGSVCRRQATQMAEELIRCLHGMGIKIHGFGFKLDGLRRVAPWLASSDSMAWSLAARKHPPIAGHTHKSCANCLDWALAWRERVVRLVEDDRPRQGLLWR